MSDINYISYREATQKAINENPTNPIEAIMADIIVYIEKKINEGLQDESTLMRQIYPPALIGMLVTNIVINMVNSSIKPSTFQIRQNVIEDFAQGIKLSIIDAWQKVEMFRAEKGTPN